MTEQGDEIRRRWLYRDLILRRRLRLPTEAARKLVGPDCAFHLYKDIAGQSESDPEEAADGQAATKPTKAR